MAWTKAQQQVIDTREKNILVSAAAGSGKTAVLVERIVRRILDREHPVDIDKILVMTFTNAAAGEMRERVIRSIDEELQKDPENVHLQKQQAFIHNAHITTMHSFCLNLVREHFNEIDLDPMVRVADEGETALMKSDVVREVMETYYSMEDEVQRERFFRFVRRFEGKNSDAAVEDLILSLYQKAMGAPYPEEWLKQCVTKYEYEDTEVFKHSEYVSSLNHYATGLLKDMAEVYDTMIDYCHSDSGLQKYLPVLCEEQKEIEAIARETDYEVRRSRLDIRFSSLPRINQLEADTGIKEMVQAMRNKVKADIKRLREKIYGQSIEEAFQAVNRCRDMIEIYTEVTETFIERFQAKKKEKNVIDFDDFEHYAIELLTTKENGRYVPSKLADELSQEFEEIMVDEYQDSNQVQETILAALSRDRSGIHNRFMVGDVKQSIYGFRGANPDIFVEKYRTYRTGGDTSDRKIILDKNFRSRRGVIDSVNYLFRQIMGEELGDIAYDEENMLYPGLEFEEPDEAFRNRIDDRTELLLVDTSEEANRAEANDRQEENDGQKEKTADDSRENKLTMGEEEEDLPLTDLEAEAKLIGQRILSLTDRHTGMVIFDKQMKAYRSLQYRDIVILLRSTGQNADCLCEELTKAGIPVYMESRTGYYKTTEISTLLDYLRVIDNPLQDIPMASVLKSMFVGITEEQLALIRTAGGKEISLYEDIKVFLGFMENQTDGSIPYEEIYAKEYIDKLVERGQVGELTGKLSAFMQQLHSWRRQVAFKSIHQLVSEIIAKTGYDDYVSAMPSGKKRMANLEMFKTKVADYEKGSYKGLFNFIRYIEKLNRYQIESGEASVIGENDDTVRIMTIHKSKGLEFPVVFLANIQKKFNFQDSYRKSVVHTKYGIGIDDMEEEDRIVRKNLIKEFIGRRLREEVLAEELRLFYVACTRARDKLIFSGSGINQKYLKKLVMHQKNDKEYLGYGVISQMRDYLDFITLPLVRNQAFEKIYNQVIFMAPPVQNKMYYVESNIEVSYLTLRDVFGVTVPMKAEERFYGEKLKKLDLSFVYSEKVKEEMEVRLQFVYPYTDQTKMHAKMSVSEIKKNYFLVPAKEEEMMESRSDEEQRQSLQEVSAAGEKKTKSNGAKRGTVYHKVFEMFDYHMQPTYGNIEMMLYELERQGFLTKEERECVWIKDFLTFAGTGLYRRMKAAFHRGELYREEQFVVGFYEKELEQFYMETSVDRHFSKQEENGDTVLIQGIIDAYFVEDGKVVLVDYKTDQIDTEEELVGHYAVQLQLYQKAIEQILNCPVAEKILYSTKLGREVIVNLEK